ncbi:MAG TPA: cupredoxin family copper-binding protein [Rhizomicrobium sp.]|jgi:plastocyanin|nr:cupredoxin family copper-binding protein [Rhizomicrobium sp.]
MIPNAIRRAFVITVSAAALITTAAAGGPPAFAEAANVVVMKNFDFSPMALTVPAGTTVTWKNLDGEPHTVTSLTGLFRSGGLDQNDTFAFKFTKPGVYQYLCTIHPRMMATITVK